MTDVQTLCWHYVCSAAAARATRGECIRFEGKSGLVWAHPANGSDQWILLRLLYPLEWLDGTEQSPEVLT